MERMIIGFTGTRKGMTPVQAQAVANKLRWFKDNYEYIEIHHGDCLGADEQVHNIICPSIYPHKIVVHPPIIETMRAHCSDFGGLTKPTVVEVLPPKDYLPRNHDIVDASYLLLATPEQGKEVMRSGTWSTIRYARKKHKQVTVYLPDGREMS